MKITRFTAIIVCVGLALLIAFGSLAGDYVYQQGFNAGQNNGYATGVNNGYVQGQKDTLANVKGILASGGIVMNWSQQSDGNYLVQILRFDSNTLMSETASIDKQTFNVLNQTGLIGDNHVPPKISCNVDWTFDIAEGIGVKEISGSSGNWITNQGGNFTGNLTAGITILPGTFTYGTNGTLYIGLGNTTTANTYTDTALLQECTFADTGFKRSAKLTPTVVNGGAIGNGNCFNFTISNKFTATQADTINGTGVFWSGFESQDTSELSTLYSEANIGTLPTGQAFAVNDNATITDTFSIQK